LKQFGRSRAIIENESAAVAEASALIPVEHAPRLRAELLRLFQESELVKGTAFAGKIRGRLAEWERLTPPQLDNRLAAARKEVQALLDRQADLQKLGQNLSPAELERLRALNAELDLGNFERAIRLYEANYVAGGQPKKTDAAGERQRIRQFQGVISTWQKVLVEARDEHWVSVNANWPDLPACRVDGVDLVNSDLGVAQTAASRYAVANRLDLMNVRAQVVDSWRQLAVYANSLLGTFTAQYQVNATSPPNGTQPLVLGGSTSSHQLVLNAELPLARIEERNNYRASLIAYQRQRRSLQEAEDLAAQAVRIELHTLRQYTEAYKVQKRQLELAYLTIDSSLESLQAPTAPPALAGVIQARSAGADGPAALTQQLLSAQRSLPAAQNGLLTIWINYLDARLQLYRDLELMPLDARGVWIDELRASEFGTGAPQPPTPSVPPNGKGAAVPAPPVAGMPAK
jgi:Outer membrane efflux protein